MISEGTNGRFTLSYEYLDQVLLPCLERFGVCIDRSLECHGCPHGSIHIGTIRFKIALLPLKTSLKSHSQPIEQANTTKIDLSILVTLNTQLPLRECLRLETDFTRPRLLLLNNSIWPQHNLVNR